MQCRSDAIERVGQYIWRVGDQGGMTHLAAFTRRLAVVVPMTGGFCKQLAPIRQLAGDLRLAPGTIARVYKELEAQGLVASRVRTGTVVQAPRRLPAAATRDQLDDAAHGYAATARRLGSDLDAAIARLRATWPSLPAD